MCHTHSDIFQINALGKSCPMPLLMLKKALKSQNSFYKICLQTSDPNSKQDILRYCQIHQLKCHFTSITAQHFEFVIEKTST